MDFIPDKVTLLADPPCGEVSKVGSFVLTDLNIPKTGEFRFLDLSSHGVG